MGSGNREPQVISTGVSGKGWRGGYGTERPPSTVTESTGLGPSWPGFKSCSASYRLRDFRHILYPLFASVSESEATVRRIKSVSTHKVPGTQATQ